MSETDEELEQEMQEIIEKETAAKEPEPKPDEPDPEPVAQESEEQPKEAETTEEVQPQPTDDSIEWAKKKGLKTPEDIARSYRELEKKWHSENQAKGNQNGFQNGFQNGNPAPQPPAPTGWQPNPYPPQGGHGEAVKAFARKHQLDEGDAERLLPAMIEIASMINRRDLTPLQQEILDIRRQSQKTSRLTQLMQDPLFADPTIAKEMHQVFESNPSLFGREDGYEIAFAHAKDSLLRQQIQRSHQKMPPTTAGGGNARSGPKPNAMKAFNAMSDEEKERYLLSLNINVPNM